MFQAWQEWQQEKQERELKYIKEVEIPIEKERAKLSRTIVKRINAEAGLNQELANLALAKNAKKT